MVRSGAANTLYGTDNRMVVWHKGSDIRRSYVRFDVQGVGGPITRATLRLYSVRGSDEGGDIFVASNDFSDGSGPWNEAGVNWLNAPTFGGPLIAPVGNVFRNQWVDIDVTSAVQGNGILTLAIDPVGDYRATYSTRERPGRDPELIVEIGP